MIPALVFTVTLLFVSHAPMNGGRNGPNCYRAPHAECFIQTGEAACAYPTGTLLHMPAWVADFGLPTVIRCNGGGGELIQAGGVIDLAYVSEDYPALHDVDASNRWGRRRVEVQVTLPPGIAYAPPPAPAQRAAMPAAPIPRGEGYKRALPAMRRDLQ